MNSTTRPGSIEGLPGFRGWPANPLRRHFAWLFPLAIIILCMIAIYTINTYAATHGYASKADSTPFIWLSLIILGLFLCIITFAIILPFKIWATWRAFRRSCGKYNKKEAIAARQNAESRNAWAFSKYLTHLITHSQDMPSLTVWEIVLNENEKILADTTAVYSRYYGTDAVYQHVSSSFYGKASFVIGGLAATAIGNAARKSSAIKQAQVQWREQQNIRLVVTTQRLMCRREDGAWLSFYLNGATAIYPECENWTLVVCFPDTEPLRLQGSGAVIACVVAVWSSHGTQGVREHPGLQAIRV